MYIFASLRQIGVAYITATSTALATAVGLNLYTKVPNVKSHHPSKGGLTQYFPLTVSHRPPLLSSLQTLFL